VEEAAVIGNKYPWLKGVNATGNTNWVNSPGRNT